MNIFKFKTNIKCNGCISQVTPVLDNNENVEKWSVDINSPQKVLTIETNDANPDRIIELVKKTGFTIEQI